MKKKPRFSNKEFIVNFRLYWNITLCATLVLILGALCFGLYLFMQENNALSAITYQSTESQVETINKDRIQKILDIFSERQTKSNTLLTTPGTVTDPSI